MPFDGTLPRPRLLRDDLSIMQAAGVIRQLRDGERPKGAVRLFTVRELHKKRRRPIKWPEVLNRFRDRDTLQNMKVVQRHVRLNVGR